jgi:hypothetical protein
MSTAAGLESLIQDGVRLSRDGDAAGALERFREAIALEPPAAEGHFNLGIALAVEIGHGRRRGRRGRRRLVEQVFQEPHAALDRVAVAAIGQASQNARMREHSAAMVGFGQRHAAELRSAHAFDLVVRGELVIVELLLRGRGVVRGQAEELRRAEHHAERFADTLLERFRACARLLPILHQPVELAAPERAGDKPW